MGLNCGFWQDVSCVLRSRSHITGIPSYGATFCCFIYICSINKSNIKYINRCIYQSIVLVTIRFFCWYFCN